MQLENEFEGDYKIQFHLAPQMFFARDPDTGRARKLTLSHRVMKTLGWLRHLKFMRHTAFDLFNRTAHRRREWALVEKYEATLEELLSGLSTENLDLAVQIAEIPEHIRGFDTVKDLQLSVALEKEAELLETFRNSVGG